MQTITGEKAREDLPATAERTKEDPNWLGKAVSEILEAANERKLPALVLTGVREVQVHDYLEEIGYTLKVFELSTAAEERYRRLLETEKIRSAKQFILHDLREKSMGLDQTLAEAAYSVQTTQETNPARITKAIFQTLKDEGTLV